MHIYIFFLIWKTQKSVWLHTYITLKCISTLIAFHPSFTIFQKKKLQQFPILLPVLNHDYYIYIFILYFYVLYKWHTPCYKIILEYKNSSEILPSIRYIFKVLSEFWAQIFQELKVISKNSVIDVISDETLQNKANLIKIHSSHIWLSSCKF